MFIVYYVWYFELLERHPFPTKRNSGTALGCGYLMKDI